MPLLYLVVIKLRLLIVDVILRLFDPYLFQKDVEHSVRPTRILVHPSLINLSLFHALFDVK